VSINNSNGDQGDRMKSYRTLIGTFVVLIGLFAGITQAQADPVAGDTVTVAGQAKAITGVNAYRSTNSFIVYTPAQGATTGTNAYGYEAAVVNGVVTTVQNGVGNMAIPSNGYVLSGHGTSRTWLATYATAGAAVTIPGGTTPPPGANTVTVAGQNKALDGTNVYRASNFLVRYTPANGATTGSNAYGFEAAVVNNVVTQVANGVGNMAIPANGYVLSGHGTSRTWLIANARVGVPVTLGGGTTDPPGKPANVTETRSNVVSANCQTLKVTVSNQTRTNTWQWNGTAWVDNWSAWTNTGAQTTRQATSADCVNLVASLSSDVLLPDIRIKNLDKCGAGDMQATGGKCFLIRNPNPSNPDFPALNGIKFLKFPVITLNVGAGPAEVIAERSSTGTNNWTAWQTFYRPNGVRESQVAPNTEFYFAGDGHNHWHFKDFDNYWIESLSGTVLRTAEKHGYCLEDNTTWSGLNGQPGVPSAPVYANATTCGQGLPNTLSLIEGLSRGWGDTYSTSLPDQGINISGLPDGRYRVGITADAIGAVRESNENNNTATIEISISGNTVTTYPATATGGLS